MPSTLIFASQMKPREKFESINKKAYISMLLLQQFPTVDVAMELHHLYCCIAEKETKLHNVLYDLG